ncbi:MAG: polyisoprenoid-binding protein [Gammaproteobacteria bacterium]|nr:polyisoprenoid-binding protein [Gammaproteobacteria bacterium]
MKKYLIVAALAAFPFNALQAADYTIDPGHTYVSFAINHLGFSTMRGKFDRQSGSMHYDPAGKKASVTVEIDAASIDTGHDKRDAHLRAPDFLNAVENPTITFESTAVTWSGDKLASVSGDLTILGVSKPVTLEIIAMNCGTHPFNKKQICGFDATASIKRSDFGVNYGLPAIGEVLDLQIEIEASKNE